MSDTSVTAKARAYFRGEPDEGDHGMVKPGDVLTLSRDRAAQLRANNLIEGDSLPDPGAQRPAGSVAPAAAPAAPAATPAKVEPITTASVAKPAEAKK